MSYFVVVNTWKVNQVLTDPTSMSLGDETGTWGIKNLSTGLSVVAAGTAMTKKSTGLYAYNFTGVQAGVNYRAYFTVVDELGAVWYPDYLDFDGPVVAGTSLGMTYSALREEVAFFLGYTRNSDDWQEAELAAINRVIEGGLRRFYNPPPLPREAYGHEWSFLFPLTSMATVASTSAYDLPADFAMVQGDLTFAPGANVLYRPIPVVSEHEVRCRLAAHNETGRPEIAAIRPKAANYGAGTSYEIVFWPTPDAAYTLYYRYRIGILSLTATEGYPPGGAEHAQTILEACLAEAESRLDDTEGVHTKRFWECLAASVSHDRQLAMHEGICYNGGGIEVPPECYPGLLHGCDQHVTTYKGVAY